MSPQKRARAVAYFNVVNGFLIFLGATLGGLFVTFLGQFSFSPESMIFNNMFKVVFLVSGIMRLAVMLYFTPKIKEVIVDVKAAPERQLFFQLVAIEPARETISGVADGLSIGVHHARQITKGVRYITTVPYLRLVRVTRVDTILKEINDQIMQKVPVRDVNELLRRGVKVSGLTERKTLLSRRIFKVPPLMFREIETVMKELARIQKLRERAKALGRRMRKKPKDIQGREIDDKEDSRRIR